VSLTLRPFLSSFKLPHLARLERYASEVMAFLQNDRQALGRVPGFSQVSSIEYWDDYSSPFGQRAIVGLEAMVSSPKY